MRDFYVILGVLRNASDQEIKAAYAQRMKLFHPDLSKSDPGAESRAKDLNEAKDTLLDRAKRRSYDEKLDAWYKGSGPGHTPTEEPSGPENPPPPRADIRKRPATEINFGRSRGSFLGRPLYWILAGGALVVLYFHNPGVPLNPAETKAPLSPSEPASTHRPTRVAKKKHKHEVPNLDPRSITVHVQSLDLDQVRMTRIVETAVKWAGYDETAPSAQTLSISVSGKWGLVTESGTEYTIEGDVRLAGVGNKTRRKRIVEKKTWKLFNTNVLHKQEDLFGDDLRVWLLKNKAN